MFEYCLRVEGVNFNDTLYDTNDLSVIRGSSLLLERVGQYCLKALQDKGMSNVSPIYNGASHAGFYIGSKREEADKAKDIVKEALSISPYCYLSFVVDVGQGESRQAALNDAEQKNKLSQFQQWTIPDCFVPGATEQDALDGVRPAEGNMPHKKGKLSKSTNERRKYGRKHRVDSLLEGLCEGAFPEAFKTKNRSKDNFCQSFQDLVSDPPAGLPRSAENKIAVIHLDGDRFGQAAKSRGVQKFAQDLEEKFKQIRKRIVEDALNAEMEEIGEAQAPRLRMEVLVWGGDDIFIVVPAWRVFLFLEGFYDTIKDWKIEGHALGFTAGVIIAQVKTPIRLLTALADCAVREGKSSEARGGVSFDVFESVAPPHVDQLCAHRDRYSKGMISSCSMAFPGSEIASLHEKLKEIKARTEQGGIGRSQIIKLLQQDTEELSLDQFNDYCDRVAGKGDLCKEDLTLPSITRADEYPRSLRANLYLIAQLWDYACNQTNEVVR